MNVLEKLSGRERQVLRDLWALAEEAVGAACCELSAMEAMKRELERLAPLVSAMSALLAQSPKS